jgi:hypothetical protein
MKHVPAYALLIFVSCTFCEGQNQTDQSKATTQSETNIAVSSYRLTNAAANRADFSGKWKLNELKSERVGNFPICIFGEEDHVSSKTMKIAEHAGFLTLDITSPSIDGELVPRQEKLTFDDKGSEALVVGSPREKSTARWSDDGQTMKVFSARTFNTNGEEADIKVTEVWTLINDGRSISVQVNVSSPSGENTMMLVYDKQ